MGLKEWWQSILGKKEAGELSCTTRVFSLGAEMPTSSGRILPSLKSLAPLIISKREE
jgi:hypothetical protein